MLHLTRTLTRAIACPNPVTVQLLAATLLFGAVYSAPASAQFWKREKPYADGSEILITGVVSDLSGNPVSDLSVELIAKRYSYKVSRLKPKIEREVRVSSRTNERGEYNIPWTWYRYYNDFALEAGVEVPTGGDTARKEVLARTELNNRIQQGSPVIAPMTITDPAFLETFRSFVAELDTEDEQRVYTAQGRPDKVDALDLPDRTEEAWWFFERGQVFRFIDGRLEHVESFDPIKP